MGPLASLQQLKEKVRYGRQISDVSKGRLRQLWPRGYQKIDRSSDHGSSSSEKCDIEANSGDTARREAGSPESQHDFQFPRITRLLGLTRSGPAHHREARTAKTRRRALQATRLQPRRGAPKKQFPSNGKNRWVPSPSLVGGTPSTRDTTSQAFDPKIILTTRHVGTPL